MSTTRHAVVASRQNLLCAARLHSFPAFFMANPPGRDYKYGRHTHAMLRIADETVKAIERGERRYLIVNVPPRHGKSDIFSRRLPAWVLCRHPEWEAAISTYGADLATDLSRDARAAFAAGMESFGQPGLRCDKQAVVSWGTMAGGACHAVGIGGPLTGRGAHVLVVDDYHSNPQEAESATYRERVWRWFQQVALTRLAPTGHALIIVANRWHEDDLCGRVFEVTDPTSKKYNPDHPRFEHVCFPAATSDGAYLFPERFSAEQYAALKAGVGAFGWNAQYLQNPQPRTGNFFRIELGVTVHIVDALPSDVELRRGWDLAASGAEQGESPDYTAGVLAGVRHADRSVWIADAVRGQWNPGRMMERVKATATQDGPGVRVRIESVAGFKVPYELLKQALAGTSKVDKVTVHTDKVSRAVVLEPTFDAGRVYLLRGPWNQELLDELRAFPGGKHDDQLDALLAAVIDDLRKPGSIWTRKSVEQHRLPIDM